MIVSIMFDGTLYEAKFSETNESVSGFYPHGYGFRNHAVESFGSQFAGLKQPFP